jgi:hypothetical protein
MDPQWRQVQLDKLVVNKPAGVTIGDGRGINAKGVIVGQWNGDPETAAAYMLVPTQMPNPSSLSLLLLLQ